MEESKGVCALSKYEKHYLLHRDSRAGCWELAFISILSSFQNSFSPIFFSYFQFVKIIYLNSKCFSLAAAHCDRNTTQFSQFFKDHNLLLKVNSCCWTTKRFPSLRNFVNKQLKIKKSKPTFVISVLKVEYWVSLVSVFRPLWNLRNTVFCCMMSLNLNQKIILTYMQSLIFSKPRQIFFKKSIATICHLL